MLLKQTCMWCKYKSLNDLKKYEYQEYKMNKDCTECWNYESYNIWINIKEKSIIKINAQKWHITVTR